MKKLTRGLQKQTFLRLFYHQMLYKPSGPTAERVASLLRDPSGRMGKIIPIVAKPCKIPPLLSIRNWIDLRDLSKFNTEMEKMICRIKGYPLPRGESLSATEIVPESVSPQFQTNLSSEPDQISESLYTNLFPITKFPSIIWSATTQFQNKRDVYKLLGDEISSFIFREGRLYTFSNLELNSNKLRRIIDTDEIRSINVRSWFRNTDKSRWLIYLLASETRKFCKKLGLYFDSTGKKYYGDKKIVTSKKFTWIAHVRKGQRGLIIPYQKFDRHIGKETTYFYRHRAVKLRFQILGDTLFLQIDPSWVFSTDGSILIQSEQRSILNTRLRSHMKNDAEFAEMRFWAWVLSNENIIRIDSEDVVIEASTTPLLFKADCGVYGDYKPIPATNYEPPPLVDEDDMFGDEYNLMDEDIGDANIDI